MTALHRAQVDRLVTSHRLPVIKAIGLNRARPSIGARLPRPATARRRPAPTPTGSVPPLPTSDYITRAQRVVGSIAHAAPLPAEDAQPQSRHFPARIGGSCAAAAAIAAAASTIAAAVAAAAA